MIEGIYEQLITKLIALKLDELDASKYYIKQTEVDKAEATRILVLHLSQIISSVFDNVDSSDVDGKIAIANNIISAIKDAIKLENFEVDLVETENRILRAVFPQVKGCDWDVRLKEITPYTRFSNSALFTGGGSDPTLESELKKEIGSSDRIDLLVSFIKWKGIVILEKELRDFVGRGGHLRVITTTYMGASDYKAIKLLASLKNTEVKVSFNTGNERLHAKAYMFYRNTGFHTAYVGSSNFSRSALTDGLEWNLKITTSEVGHLIDKFQKVFNRYWESKDFESFNDSIDAPKLIEALNRGNSATDVLSITSYFDLTPHDYQCEIMEQLDVQRLVHNRYRNLVVAATGTGKTIISAFDYKRFLQNRNTSKLLFVAHRKEILVQAIATFRGVLKDNNFGELWVDGLVPKNFDHVFASVQTLNNNMGQLNLDPDNYDFIVIDEVHHIAATSYRPIINYFKPTILLGLTATPERMDNANILEDFCNHIAAEIRLPEALNSKILCPFQYFGISDNIDLSGVQWVKGKYMASELSDIYTSNDQRVGEIITNLDRYTKDLSAVRALGFCVTMEHAKYMAEKFLLAGLKAAYLTSNNTGDRDKLRLQLVKKEINYLFVVDIFNEGVDIPQIDTILFLRPTESLTVFLQQLGRGLRLSDKKECLTVLDFVGNARPEYNFENKFRALIGKTTTPVRKEIEDNFPHLPLGCSIILERKAKESILKNIISATTLNRNQIIKRIQNFQFQTDLPLSLKNFLAIYNIPLQLLYKRGGWKRLCNEAGLQPDFDNLNESAIVSAILNKWLASSSSSYFQFVLDLTKQNFKVNLKQLDQTEQQMLLMLHYDVWQQAAGYDSLDESISAIGKNQVLVDEIREVMEVLLDTITLKELNIILPYSQPLKVHSRYTRDQILTAFGMNTFEKASSYRIGGGVAENKSINTEILFVDLVKSEEDYSPTTMYNDYAVSDSIFHWQSQNQTRSDYGKGLTYINHKNTGKIILLFIREKSSDEFGNTLGYVFVGEGTFKDHYGSKPMSINWNLNEPMPIYLWKSSTKISAG